VRKEIVTDHTAKTSNKKGAAEYLFKINILGDPLTLYSYLTPSYTGPRSRISDMGIELFDKKVHRGNCTIKLLLTIPVLDYTAIIKRNPSLKWKMYAGVRAGIFVSDISSQYSFERSLEFHKEFNHHLSSSPHKPIPLAFICIKNGPTEVPSEKMESFAATLEMDYYEVEKNNLETFDKVLFSLVEKIVIY
jgi:hypothetical protein